VRGCGNRVPRPSRHWGHRATTTPDDVADEPHSWRTTMRPLDASGPHIAKSRLGKRRYTELLIQGTLSFVPWPRVRHPLPFAKRGEYQPFVRCISFVYLLTSVGCFLHFVHLHICPLGHGNILELLFSTRTNLIQHVKKEGSIN